MGIAMAANIAIMAITTSNSIRVKAAVGSRFINDRAANLCSGDFKQIKLRLIRRTATVFG
jgi:hypothetical protein